MYSIEKEIGDGPINYKKWHSIDNSNVILPDVRKYIQITTKDEILSQPFIKKFVNFSAYPTMKHLSVHLTVDSYYAGSTVKQMNQSMEDFLNVFPQMILRNIIVEPSDDQMTDKPFDFYVRMFNPYIYFEEYKKFESSK